MTGRSRTRTRLLVLGMPIAVAGFVIPRPMLLAVVVVGVSFPVPTLAEDLADPDPIRIERAVDWRMNLGTGGFVDDASGGGVELSLLTTLRYRFVEAGLLLDVGSPLFNGSHRLVGGALGGVYQSPAGLRAELLAIAGKDAYAKIGCGLFCRSGGASAAFPWIGARFGLSYMFIRNRKGHFELGGAATLGSDTDSAYVQYSTTSTSLYGDGTSTTTHHTTLGGVRSTYLLVMGGVLDLW